MSPRPIDTASLDAAAAHLAKPEPVTHESPRHERLMRRLRRGEHAITELEKMELIYLLGGARGAGHITAPTVHGQAWTDCSGFQCYDLAIMGIQLRDPTGWTGSLVEEGHEGTSPYFTLFLKEPDQTEGHVISRRRHKPHVGPDEWRWAECGGSDNPHPGGGPTWFHPTPERIAEFPYQRHFKVLS